MTIPQLVAPVNHIPNELRPSKRPRINHQSEATDNIIVAARIPCLLQRMARARATLIKLLMMARSPFVGGGPSRRRHIYVAATRMRTVEKGSANPVPK
jgi:hypothetical protein